MNITIAGYGFVGKAIEHALKTKHIVSITDPAVNKVEIYQTDPDAVIICVSTPTGIDGILDMKNVLDVVENTPYNIPILVKSTISLTGWKQLIKKFPKHSISVSPEFLRANSALEDFANQEYMIIGGSASIWKKIFLSVQPDLCFEECTPEEAITTKYTVNSFLALKVSYFNQLYDFCKTRKNLKFETVRNLVSIDTRIGEGHTMVTKERGFGGHCFPKDTESFVKEDENSLTILNEAIKYNNKVRESK